MKTKLILAVLLPLVMLSTTATSRGEDGNLPVWQAAPSVPKGKYLFLGFQEAQFIRAKLGEWLPVGLLEVGESDEIYYSIESVTRKDLEMAIQLEVYNKTTAKKCQFRWQWTLPTGVDDVEVVATKPGVVEVRYPKAGEVREIRLARALDLPQAKEEFKISRAAPLWEWRIMPWANHEK
jgi:hypothetical protein